MHYTLLAIHSWLRWVVLLLLLISIYRALVGFMRNKPFTNADNAFRHWTATAAHLQLLVGIILYTQSPIVKSFWSTTSDTVNIELTFYGLIHIGLMLLAVTVLTVGSGFTKRKQADKEKHKTMLVWYTASLLIIFIAIPWTFSPFVNRPTFRPFSP